MARKKVRRKHMVKGKVTIQSLSKTGTSAEFEIYADEEKIGHLVIGRGSLIWHGGKRKSRKMISWTRFAELMDDFTYGD